MRIDWRHVRLVHAKPPAVNDMVGAGDEGGVLGTHEEDDIDKLLDLARPPQRSRHSAHLLYLRFTEQRGETILEAIRKRQLEEVAKLLQTTKLSTEKIAALCGFANANVLRNLFKRAFSISMRDYRKSKAPATDA